MEPPKTVTGINFAQVLQAVLVSMLIATISGLFSMYGKNALLEERLTTLQKSFDKLEAKVDKNKDDQAAFRETTNERLNTVDAVKTSFDNLTRSAQERK